jgi:hypothetical protein
LRILGGTRTFGRMSSFSRHPLPAAHPDHTRIVAIAEALEKPNEFGETLSTEYPYLVDDTITQAIDATRTGRTDFYHLSPEEKKHLGSLIEARIRDLLGVPRGTRDLSILGEEIDVKNTISSTWMVPRETYEIQPGQQPGLLLLSQYDPNSRVCSLGLILARQKYLTSGRNRDGKLSVSANGRKQIWWMVHRAPLPPDIWARIDIASYRRLRQVRGGTNRAAEFFELHLGIPIERSIVQSLLFDQKDYMKRLRSNGGARDLLSRKGIALRREQHPYSPSHDSKRYYDYWIAERTDTV